MDSFGFEDPPPRFSSASRSPAGFSREIIDEVWLSAEPIDGNDDALWRLDEQGNRLLRPDYGKRSSEFGWEITENGSGNLKAVHCRLLDSPPPASPDESGDGLTHDTLELF